MPNEDLSHLVDDLFPAQREVGTSKTNAAGWATASWIILDGEHEALSSDERLALTPLAHQTLRAERSGEAFLARAREHLASDARFLQVLSHVEAWNTQSMTHVGDAPPSATADLPARVIGGFEIEGPLAEGGMGQIFRARQVSLDRPVALKILPTDLQHSEKFVERFQREGKAAAKLRHTNIVHVIEAGRCEQTGINYIAFELVEGQTAKQLLLSKGRLPEEEALLIARSVAEALACAEDSGIVHRDIKPSNILIGADGVAKVSDLGVAKYVGENSRRTTQGLVIGTPHYIAPEQALAVENIDIRSDLYALGITLYQLTSGKLPFKSPTPMGIITLHVSAEVPDVREVEPSISERTAHLISFLSARVRDRRYRTAREAAENIQLVLAGEDPLPPAGVPAPKPKPKRPKIISGYYDDRQLLGDDGPSADG